jgi:hypothetical protein
MNFFDTIREHLSQPEYVHVLINPLPVYGLAMGVIAMVIALVSRSRVTMISALILVFIAAMSAWPTYHYGEAGYDRVKSMADSNGGKWLDEHMERGEKLIAAFYVLAAVAGATLLVPIKWPRSAFALAFVTLVLGLGTLGIGGWIAFAGGQVRHKEFRTTPPPEHHEHHHDE